MKNWGALFSSLVVFLSLCTPSPAFAYTIQSGFSRSCHERISLPALEFFLVSLSETREIPVPNSDVWRGATGDVAGTLASRVALDDLMADEGLEFAAVSLLIGLREPDTDGYSVTDLNAIRSVHGNGTPASQYAHCLRAAEDEGAWGDLQALAGARAVISEHMEEMQRYLTAPGLSQITTSPLYVEHYGRIDVEVWGPAYRLGLALHVLQDSFSHTIRTEDGAHVLHVLNYVDAFQGRIDEDSDGLSHSTGMDDCDRAENHGHVLSAEERSVALVAAALKITEGDGGQALEAGLNDCQPENVGDVECGFLAYHPECRDRVEAGESLSGTCCSRDTEFCDARLLASIVATPTRPYLRPSFGCQLSRGGRLARDGWWTWAGILSLVLFLRRFRGRGRTTADSKTPGMLLAAAAAVSTFSLASSSGAQERFPSTFVFSAEAHGSLLTDAPRESLLNISYGPTVRAGYRFSGGSRGQWGVFSFFERDVWVVSDYELRADPGVMNFGLGVELLYFGFLRSSYSIGPSILVFDTALHDEGNTGFFSELRPLGAEFRFLHRWALTFDPLSVAWVNPTPEGGNAPSVSHFQYRTSLGLVWRSVPLP